MRGMPNACLRAYWANVVVKQTRHDNFFDDWFVYL
jgi:hypothetical protein